MRHGRRPRRSRSVDVESAVVVLVATQADTHDMHQNNSDIDSVVFGEQSSNFRDFM